MAKRNIARAGSVYQTRAWRRLSTECRERDGYRCRLCGAAGYQIGGTARLSGAHRIPERVRPDLALEPSNVVTLCLPCHGRADGGRRYERRT